MKQLILAILFISVLLLAACTTPTTTSPTKITATPTTTTTTTTSLTPTTTKTTTPATTLSTTWGGLFIAGDQSFSDNCASCHGSEGAGGSGPAIIGPNLKSFETAQGLFNDIQATMPPNAVSLPIQWYLDILAFMLIESEFVQPEDSVNSDDLVNVLLNE